MIGTGYLGATHAACMAILGHDVVGVDVDAQKVAELQSGRVPFHEPGLPGILSEALASGRLRFTTDMGEAARARVHFLAVGTPQQSGSYAADLTQVEGAIDALIPFLDGANLILGKSTVPVGTAAALQHRIDSAINPGPSAATVEVAWNPEFLREGHAVHDTLHPDRIVVGTRDEARTRVEETIRAIYAAPLAEGTPLMMMGLPTAELVKVSANAFLATKISFINAISEICEATGADVVALADALGADQRIGRAFLGAGLGFGGGCLPKDIRAFMARAGELGVDQALTFLREVDEINQRRRDRVVELARQLLGGTLPGRRVCVLGAAFKPQSDDVRDSPALAVAGALSLGGAEVTVFDPAALANAARVFPTLGYADTAEDALAGADVVVLATEWPQFREIDPVAAGRIVRGRRIIDARNVLDPRAWREAGWEFLALGRGRVE